MAEMSTSRRTFLKVLGGAAAAGAASHPFLHAFADPPESSRNEFFVLIHASGAWDVMLSLDPRTEARGPIEPPSTEWLDTEAVRHWTDAPLAEGTSTFRVLEPAGTRLRLGPAIGNMLDFASRMTVVNGLAMNTVSHPDGTFFMSTGRHLSGGRAVAASMDTMLSDALGREQLFPSVSVQFPSSFVGDELDARVSPLRIASVETVSRVLQRANQNTLAAERQAVTAVLTQESQDLLRRSFHRDAMQGFALQYQSLERMLQSNLQSVFQGPALQTAQPDFNYRGRFHARAAINAAFAVEAMKRNAVRCVSFGTASFDTHGSNYRTHALLQQELFDVLATLVRSLDAAPHPTLRGERLAAHTHILVFSDFCRTPQINLTGGRDHYPNGSALIISPRFRGGATFGSSDAEQLLPARATAFPSGMRAIAPPDLLATFLAAFGIDPRRYMRDGEVLREMLRT